VLDITSSTTFAALTVRWLTNERGDFLLATFPVAGMTLAAPAPIVFPRIADGGGYVTQFILIGAGGASSVTLNFYGEDGKPPPVGKFLLGSQNALGDALKNFASGAYPHLVFPGCLYLALADRPVYEPAKMSNTKFPGRAIASDVLRTMSNYPAGFGFPTGREFRC
jgi:hypothetical protein